MHSLFVLYLVITDPRWYEVRRDVETGVYSRHQQGTFGPNDNIHRFYSSGAQDKLGNIAIGYGTSGESEFPSLRAVGRSYNTNDPLGTLDLAEVDLFDGTGSQIGADRWGGT